jgi:Holliday junction DNA helicase RuvB
MAIKRSTPSSNEPDKSVSQVEETLLKPTVTPEEIGSNEETIRPQTLDEYIGQKDLKEVLKIAIQAAQNRKEPIDHLLLYGPPGLGKTTLSLILATEMDQWRLLNILMVADGLQRLQPFRLL